MLAKLEILKRDNEVKESQMKFSSDVLRIEISKYKQQLTDTRKKHDDKVTELSSMLKESNHLKAYANDKETLEKILSNVNVFEEYAEIKASREYLTNFYNILNSILQTTRKELIEINKICAEQDSLISRLDKEVNSVIDQLKVKYNDSKLVESSLFELPINYTRSFVNRLIETTNYFVAEVMTYPMMILPIDDGNRMDFSFPIVVDDVRLKDINGCSDGQKAIVTLAFNLALIIELGLNDYPIYIDEVDRALDTAHSKRLSELLNMLMEKNIVSQLFAVNHHPSFIDYLTDKGIIVLNGDNIDIPHDANENVEMTYY